MYIHEIKSGDKKQYVKYLLRVGKRMPCPMYLSERSMVKNTTVINLSSWKKEHLDNLTAILKMKRQNKNTLLEKEIDKVIIQSVIEYGVKEGLNSFQSMLRVVNALNIPLDERNWLNPALYNQKTTSGMDKQFFDSKKFLRDGNRIAYGA